MKLSKLEAARRQLDVASSLFVVDGDILAVHTLAGAAEEMLGALLQRKAQENMFSRIRTVAEQRLGREISDKELSALVNHSRNLLKHANDPNEDLFDYDADHSVGMLFRGLINYQLLTGGLSGAMEEALDILRKRYPSSVDQGV